jgi:hypothetical protein
VPLPSTVSMLRVSAAVLKRPCGPPGGYKKMNIVEKANHPSLN